MLKPRALQPGDQIAIVSPASPFERPEFERGVGELRRLGFTPVYEESVFTRTGYVSGPAELRAGAFRRAWEDPAVRALIAARGGYGSTHLLPHLDANATRRHPKLFIGYSDTTAMLTWLTCCCGIGAIHGPMLERRLASGGAGYDQASFVRLVTGDSGFVLDPPGVAVLRDGEAAGPMFGGNLSQLVASLGTPYAFDPPPGSILFLEDVNERPYRLDRMLTQLVLSGVLSRAAGIVFGEMPGCDEPGGTVAARAVLESFVGNSPGPVLIGFPSGHTSGSCWSLPFGVRVRIVTRPAPSLLIEEAVVE